MKLMRLTLVRLTSNARNATNDQFITRRNTDLVISGTEVIANDSDADGDAITLLPFGTPAHGTLTASGNGGWTYHPNAGFVGTDTISYQISDGVSSSAVASILVNVLNSAPVAAGDRFEVPHDLAFVVAAGRIQTNDFDLEGDTLTVSVVDNVRNGTLTMQGSGAFTYTPNAGFTGRDSFSYRLYDGNLYSDPERVILDVVNHRPTTRDGSHRMTHDTVLTRPAASGLLAGARDTDGDALTASIVSTVRNGTLVVQPDGSWTYTPATHFVGTDSFTYRVSDGSLTSVTKTVTIDVSNTPVVASLDAYTVTPNTPLNVAAPGVLQNDSDIDGDTLTLTVVDNVLHGTLSLQQNGSFIYTPTAGYIGQDSFTYKVSDGLEAATATVQLTVLGIPQTAQTTPVARKDFYSTPHSTLLTVSSSAGLLGNDRDPNNDPLTVQLVTSPGHGTLTLNTNGSFSYSPSASFVGLDTFTYRSSDGTNLSAITTAEINVRNTLPWAANAAFETHQGSTLSTAVGQLSRFAGDNNQDPLTFSVVTNPSHGTLTLNSSGTFSFVPAAGYSGPDSFTYRVADQIGHSPTATVSIDVTNERPTAYDLDFRTQHGQVYNGTGRGVLAGAADQDNDTLTAQLVTGAAHGTVVVNSDGTFTYTPTAGYAGNDQFVFRVNDGATNSYDAVVRLTVGNQAPVASDGFQSTQHDKPAVIELHAFDADGDALVYELVSTPQHGTLTYENVINNGSNGQPVRFTGKVTFHPTAGFVGDDAFQYRVNDGVNNSEPSEVSLSVRNFAPKAASSLQRTTPGSAITVTGTGLLATASDPDGDTLTLSIVTQPAHGTLTLVQTNGVYTGGYTYTPNTGYAGPDSFSWRVSDGATVSDTVTVTMDVQNNVPIIADRSFMQRFREASVNGTGQRTYTVDLAAAGIAMDADANVLQYQIVTNGQHGTATLTPQGVLSWTSTSNTYVGNDTITVRVTDGYSFSDNAEITIAVDNTKPTAAGNFYSIHHNSTVSITPEKLLGNDFDFDGDTLHIVSITNGAHGTLTQSGDTWTFNPNGWVGTTELTYIVSDGLVNSEPATIEIEVTNAPVWGIDRSFIVTESGSIDFEISTTAGNVWSPDGDAVTVSFSAQPSNGTLTAIGSNRWRYSPTAGVQVGYDWTPGFLGHDSLTFTLSDGQTQSPSVTYSFNVVDNAGKTSSGVNPNETNLPGLWNSYLNSPASPPLSTVAPPLAGGLQRIEMRPTENVTRTIDLQGGIITSVTVDSVPVNVSSGTYSGTFLGGGIDVTPSGQITMTSVGSGSTKNRIVISVLQNGQSIDFALDVVVVNHAPVFGLAVFSGPGAVLGRQLAPYASDPDGDSLSFGSMPGSSTVVTTYTNPLGTLEVSRNGDVTFQNLQAIYLEQQAVKFVVPVFDAYGLETSQTVVFAPFYEKFFPSPAEYPATPTSPIAVDDVFRFLSPHIAVGNVLINDVKRGPGPWTAGLLSGVLGTMGRITLDGDGTVYYELRQWYEEPFLNEYGEPTVFYYAITNGLGESDVGAFRIDKTVIGMGGSAAGITSSARSMQDWVAVAFDGTFPAWITRQTPGGNYVVDQFGGSSSKVYWSGNTTANLSLNLEGRLVSTTRNSGTLGIRSYSIDQPVFASAFTSIEGLIHINALFAAGSGGSIWTAVEAGPLLVGGNVQQLHLGYYNDLYGSGNIASLQWNSPILIGGNLDWTWVYGNLTGLMTVGGKIGRLMVTHDISGSVIAGDSISDCYDIGYTVQPFHSGSISGYVYAGKDIPEMHTGVVTGLVETGRDIGLFTLTSIQGDVHAGRDLNTLEITGSAAGTILAGRNIGKLSVAGGDLLSSIQAGLNIGIVAAFGDIAGIVTATAGSIMSLQAGQAVNSTGGSILSYAITAGISIGKIGAHKQGTSGKGRVLVPGGITGTAGYIGLVAADADVIANIKASDDIGAVTAGTFIHGEITSTTGSILTVTAGTGRIEGEIKADKNIGTVTAYTDRLGNTTSTTGSILSVIATQGQINGAITAQNTLGTISAGTDITGNITATTGSIDKILAGTHAPGNLTGDISAALSILTVTANGKLPDPLLTPEQMLALAEAMRLLDAAFSSESLDALANLVLPQLPVLPKSIKGDFSGKISASLLIGKVTADGSITGGTIEADRVNEVWAFGDIDNAIESTVGSVAVTTWGTLKGSVNANRGIAVFAYGDEIGNITSNNGSASVRTMGHQDGSVTARDVARSIAYKEIHSEIKSINGAAIARTLESINTNVRSANNSIAEARTSITGDVVAKSGFVTVFADSMSGILTNSESLAQEDISGLFSGFPTSPGEILQYVIWGDVNATFGPGTTRQANGKLDIYSRRMVNIIDMGSLNLGNVIADRDITLSSWGNVSADKVSSDRGGIKVESHNVSGRFITGAQNVPDPWWDFGGIAMNDGINIGAWGTFDGSIQSATSASVFAQLDATMKSSNSQGTFQITSGGIVRGSEVRGSGGVKIDAADSIYVDSIKSIGNIALYAGNRIVSNIMARADYGIDPATGHGPVAQGADQDVFIHAGGRVSSTVISGGHTRVTASGGFGGSVDAGGFIIMSAGADSTVKLKSDDEAIQTPRLQNLDLDWQTGFGITLTVFGKITGEGSAPGSTASSEADIQSEGDVVIFAFGDVNTTIDAGGSVNLQVHVSGGTDASPTASNFTGSVTTKTSASIQVAGNIKATVKAEQYAKIVAYGNVEQTEVIMGSLDLDAPRTVMVGADGQIDDLKVRAARSVEISAIEGITKLRVENSGPIKVDSHAAAEGTFNNVFSVDIGSKGNLAISGKSIVSLLVAKSFEGKVSVDIPEMIGDVYLQSYQGIEGTLVTNGNITAKAMQNITSSLTGATFDVYSLQSVDATLTATGPGESIAYGKDTVAGKLEAKNGLVFAIASGSGGVTAEVTAGRLAAALALAGSVTGPVTATAGNAVAVAAMNVSGSVSAMVRADVDAGLNVSGLVTVSGIADVLALSDVSSAVTSFLGSASVFAGNSVLGNVRAQTWTAVTTMIGNVSGTVTAVAGKATIYSGGTITGVTRAGSITAMAVKEVSGTLTSTSGSTFALSMMKGITSEVNAANGDVTLFARDAVTGKITSGGDTTISTWSTSSSDVTAGRDIIITTGDHITGSLTAGRNAILYSSGNTNVSLVKAETGDVDIEAWGTVEGEVQAPAGLVSIWSGGGVNSTTITAQKTASVYSYGDIDANITTSDDLYVFGNKKVAGIFNAVTLIDVGALGDLDIQMATAGKADIYSLGNAKVIGDADKGVVIVSDGSLELDVTADDGDVITWSLDGTRGTIEAGKYADSVSWGPTDLETDGDLGAYVWSYGALSGELTSTLGYAIGVSLWDNSADYDSLLWSEAIAGGNVSGMVYSDGDAIAFAGGNVASPVVWGLLGDAIVLSFGSSSSDVRAGHIAIVVAAQNITNLVQGDYAAVAFAGANLDAAVKSKGSVWLAAAGGNITGAITAHNTVSEVFAWGIINAIITAGDETGGAGVVSSVEAIGSIAGQIIATASIGTVRSGSTVTATLSAPVKPVPVENDPNVAIENPPLEPWDSGIDEIRTAMAARRAEWAAKKYDAESFRDTEVSNIKVQQKEQHDRIAAGYSDRSFYGETLIIPERLDDMMQYYDDFKAEMTKRADEQSATDGKRYGEFVELRSQEETARTEALAQASQAYSNSIKEYNRRTNHQAANKEQLALSKAASIKNLEEGKNAFDAEAPTVWKQTKDWLAWGGNFLISSANPVSQFTNTWEHGKQMGTALGEVGVNDIETIVGYGLADHFWYLQAHKAYTGVDPLTGVELTDKEIRTIYYSLGFEAAVAVASVVIAAGFRVKGPNCFVGDTPIVIGINDTAAAFAVHPPIDFENNSPWAAVCILLGAFTGVAVLIDERRKRNVLHPAKSLGYDPDDNATDQLFQDSDSMTMLSEAATSVGPACRAGLPTKVAQPINSSNQTSNTHRTPSLLPRSSGEKVADRPDEGVAVTERRPQETRRFSSTLKAVSVLTVLFGLWLGFGGRSIDPVTTSAIAEAVTSHAPNPKYKTVAIREIQPAGYKVLADNPQTPGQAAGDFGEFDPKTWQVHRFLMNKPDGGWLKIGLARPMAWIESVERNDSGQVWLEFEELGIADWATLQKTELCPATILGEGRLVTGTFEHSSGDVLNLFIAGEAAPIGTTAGHYFWSEDRQDFAQVGTFGDGERLRLADGTITYLDRIEPVGEKQAVYNLEVDGEHVYYVGAIATLVHNTSNEHHTIPQYMGGKKKQVKYRMHEQSHRDLHELLDNFESGGVPPRYGAPNSYGNGPVRNWGRENGGIRFFAAESAKNRKLIVDTLRRFYEENGYYRTMKDIFEAEAENFIHGR